MTSSILDQKPQENAKKGIDGWIDGENGTILTSAYGYFKDSLEVHQDRPNSPLSESEKYQPPGSPQQPPSPPAANKPGSITITGEGKDGTTLTASITDADGVPSSVSYQWKRDGQNIANATANTYTLTNDDKGKKISVYAEYKDNKGNQEKLTSNEIAVEAGAPGPQGQSGPRSVPQGAPSATPRLDAALAKLKLPDAKTATARNYKGTEDIKLNLLRTAAFNHYDAIIKANDAAVPEYQSGDVRDNLDALDCKNAATIDAFMTEWEHYAATIELFKEMKTTYTDAMKTIPAAKQAAVQAAYRNLDSRNPGSKQALLDAIANANKTPKTDAAVALLGLPAGITNPLAREEDDDTALGKLSDLAKDYYKRVIDSNASVMPEDKINTIRGLLAAFDINDEDLIKDTWKPAWAKFEKDAELYAWAKSAYDDAIAANRPGLDTFKAAWAALDSDNANAKTDFNNAKTAYYA
nr:MAG TPA: hypothetical protein [Caudoviricetes sp.]